MKALLASLALCTLAGCATVVPNNTPSPSSAASHTDCPGNSAVPSELAHQFEAADDSELLAQSLGAPEAGKLCQGKVYQSRANSQVRLFRAWNSTNPNSKMGVWWAWQVPSGAVNRYRADYEICYQWSPLDMLVQCTLKPQQKVVVGTGQSARCSDYLSYPAAATQQIYIPDASNAMTQCQVLQAEFQWSQVAQ